jgi:hypothetical protein
MIKRFRTFSAVLIGLIFLADAFGYQPFPALRAIKSMKAKWIG